MDAFKLSDGPLLRLQFNPLYLRFKNIALSEPLLVNRLISPTAHVTGINVQPMHLFRQAPGKGFFEISQQTAPVLAKQFVGRGGAQALHFGLGPAIQIDELTIYWPDGAVEKHQDIESDRLVTFKHVADL
ncbi:MAG: hypothetical protein DRR08_18910 [Candidatus Parabeggiatoa sp. nov. 2]|nr:MAG: hypothetical protein DRR08_18910 [Gammaproteobacteria bacterium]